jgi:phage terminase large subunit
MMTSVAKDPIPNEHLLDFWLTPARFRILYGGRDSSKSWDAATRAAWIAHRIPVRVLCTRMYQNKIEESVYTLIKKQIQRFKFPGYRILNNKIVNEITGSEFLFYGLARNIDEIKSLEGIDIAWLEEAHSVTEDMWEVLEPTVRKEHSEFWVVMNPRLRTDFAYQRFIELPPNDSIVRKINYDENPFLTDTSRQTIERIKEEDYDAYEHIYLGYPKQDDESVIIKRAWIESCIDAHKKLGIEISGEKIVGFDPADGGDENAIVKKYGNLIQTSEEWKAGEDELMMSCKKAYNHTSSIYEIVYDSVGVGASAGSKFKEINELKNKDVKYHAFNAGGKVIDPDREYKEGVKNKDHFSNIKAQAWWNVADRIRETYNAVEKGHDIEESKIISIDSNCLNLEKIITELSTPKRDYDNAGRVKVESKKDLTKRGISSPNLADAFIMCFAPRVYRKPLTPQVIDI